MFEKVTNILGDKISKENLVYCFFRRQNINWKTKCIFINIYSVSQTISILSVWESVSQYLSCQSNSLICTLCILYPCKTLIEFSKRLCSHTKAHAFRLCLVILYIASYILIALPLVIYYIIYCTYIYIYIYIYIYYIIHCYIYCIKYFDFYYQLYWISYYHIYVQFN